MLSHIAQRGLGHDQYWFSAVRASVRIWLSAADELPFAAFACTCMPLGTYPGGNQVVPFDLV